MPRRSLSPYALRWNGLRRSPYSHTSRLKCSIDPRRSHQASGQKKARGTRTAATTGGLCERNNRWCGPGAQRGRAERLYPRGRVGAFVGYDLHDFVRDLEARGELKRIRVEVDPELEIAE